MRCIYLICIRREVVSSILLNLVSKACPDILFSLFLFCFPLRQIYVVLKTVKLLDRAWPMLAETVCRAQSWLQSMRWISGCAIDGLYAGCRADNRAKKAENIHSRNYVHTWGLGRGVMRFVTESKSWCFDSSLIFLQGKQSRNHCPHPHHQFALLCFWWSLTVNMVQIYTQPSKDCEVRSGKYLWSDFATA